MKLEKIDFQNEDFATGVVLHNIIKKYENYSSISKIKNSVSFKINLSSNHTLRSARQVTSNEVKSILESLSTKKASGTDKIPTKNFRLASNFLSKSLAKAINNELVSSKFSDIAKIATVGIIDKKTDGNMVHLTFDL